VVLLLLVSFRTIMAAPGPVTPATGNLVEASSRDRRIVKRWKLPGKPRGLALHQGVAYVGLSDRQSVLAVEVGTGRILREAILDSAHIAATKDLVTVRVSPGGKRLIVANGSDESATLLSLPDLSVVREIGLEGETIRDALVDPSGRYLLVLGNQIHLFDAAGGKELRTFDVGDPMAIAVNSTGSAFAVAHSERFVNGTATVVSLFDLSTFKQGDQEPLQTDRRIVSMMFAAGDRSLVVFARDWIGEKPIRPRVEKLLSNEGDKMRMRIDFGDLTNSEGACLPEVVGPQIAVLGPKPSVILFAERRCSVSGSFTASERNVATASIYGVAAYAVAFDPITNTLLTTDPAGFLTIYRAPKPGS